MVSFVCQLNCIRSNNNLTNDSTGGAAGLCLISAFVFTHLLDQFRHRTRHKISESATTAKVCHRFKSRSTTPHEGLLLRCNLCRPSAILFVTQVVELEFPLVILKHGRNHSRSILARVRKMALSKQATAENLCCDRILDRKNRLQRQRSEFRDEFDSKRLRRLFSPSAAITCRFGGAERR